LCETAGFSLIGGKLGLRAITVAGEHGLSHLSQASLVDGSFLQVAREKKSATRWAAFSIMQYGGSLLTAIQSQVPARVLVFVFLQKV
jgi:predicted alpha/beta hydrolase